MVERYWFLATPYRAYPLGLDAAFKLACETRALLIKAGVSCFSPIVHSHPVAMACPGLDAFSDIWLTTEAPMRLKACGMIELRADGWEQSAGMAKERAEFETACKRVVPMVPGVVPDLG